jgi:hypothetical protein
MSSKRRATRLVTALGAVLLTGTVACKRSENVTEQTPLPLGSQTPRHTGQTAPGTSPTQQPGVPTSPNTR